MTHPPTRPTAAAHLLPAESSNLPRQARARIGQTTDPVPEGKTVDAAPECVIGCYSWLAVPAFLAQHVCVLPGVLHEHLCAAPLPGFTSRWSPGPLQARKGCMSGPLFPLRAATLPPPAVICHARLQAALPAGARCA